MKRLGRARRGGSLGALACLIVLSSWPALAVEVAPGDRSPAASEVSGAGVEESYVLFDTSVGPIAVELLPAIAPKHVAQIRRLIELGAYDGVPIFRIHRGFVAQVHDVRARPAPLTAQQSEAIERIPGEFSQLRHERGVLSMARGDDPNGAETSFSFLLGPAPHLDGEYTIFGRTLGNAATLQAIEAAAGPDPMQPLEAIAIRRAVIVDRTTARSIADASMPKAGGLDRPNGATDRIPPWPLLILTTTVALLALATALVAIRTGGRGLISLALATFLCAFFVVFAVLFSELELFGPLRPWMAMLLFAASVASFKLMGLYDSAGRPRRG